MQEPCIDVSQDCKLLNQSCLRLQAEIEQVLSGGLMDGVDDDLLNELKVLEEDILKGDMAEFPSISSVVSIV